MLFPGKALHVVEILLKRACKYATDLSFLWEPRTRPSRLAPVSFSRRQLLARRGSSSPSIPLSCLLFVRSLCTQRQYYDWWWWCQGGAKGKAALLTISVLVEKQESLLKFGDLFVGELSCGGGLSHVVLLVLNLRSLLLLGRPCQGS